MKRLYTGILLVILLLQGCKGDVFPPAAILNQLENDGAVMPVHIHGNTNSKTAIIVIHGGPGESSILMRESVGFFKLEVGHQVVYYDQRSSGISEGNVSVGSLNVEQMAEDLHAVTELVSTITNAENIFLVSLDWGSAIATSYLASDRVSELVKGYIAVSPVFNGREYMQQARAEIIEIAEDTLADNNNSNDAAAENILSFYDSNPEINRFNYDENYRLIDALAGIILNREYPVSGATVPEYIQSSVDNNRLRSLDNWSFNGEHFLESLDLESQTREIDVPVKVVWGMWDRLFPTSMSEDYVNLLGDGSSGAFVVISIFCT